MNPRVDRTAQGCLMAAVSSPIGFVGIGNMGAPMVRCLVKTGFRPVIYDVNAENTKPFGADPSVAIAASLREVARACSVIITMLPDSKIVRAVVVGTQANPGLASTLRPDSLIIDMSSSYPIDTVALGKEIAASDIALVDAPVSGGVGKAVTGTLAIMAGGAADDVTRATPILSAMGTVMPTGALGTGHAVKALNNYVSAAGLIATCEALLVGQKFGLDPTTMTAVLNASTGRNNTTENKAVRYLIPRTFNSGFALALMNKDVGMAAALATELGLDAKELTFVSRYLADVAKSLGTSADHTAVMAYVEKQA
jgi:3-hydroxyisobutyrate dehydrogenase